MTNNEVFDWLKQHSELMFNMHNWDGWFVEIYKPVNTFYGKGVMRVEAREMSTMEEALTVALEKAERDLVIEGDNNV